jgi:hypothetical protein
MIAEAAHLGVDVRRKSEGKHRRRERAENVSGHLRLGNSAHADH